MRKKCRIAVLLLSGMLLLSACDIGEGIPQSGGPSDANKVASGSAVTGEFEFKENWGDDFTDLQKVKACVNDVLAVYQAAGDSLPAFPKVVSGCERIPAGVSLPELPLDETRITIQQGGSQLAEANWEVSVPLNDRWILSASFYQYEDYRSMSFYFCQKWDASTEDGMLTALNEMLDLYRQGEYPRLHRWGSREPSWPANAEVPGRPFEKSDVLFSVQEAMEDSTEVRTAEAALENGYRMVLTYYPSLDNLELHFTCDVSKAIPNDAGFAEEKALLDELCQKDSDLLGILRRDTIVTDYVWTDDCEAQKAMNEGEPFYWPVSGVQVWRDGEFQNESMPYQTVDEIRAAVAQIYAKPYATEILDSFFDSNQNPPAFRMREGVLEADLVVGGIGHSFEYRTDLILAVKTVKNRMWVDLVAQYPGEVYELHTIELWQENGIWKLIDSM